MKKSSFVPAITGKEVIGEGRFLRLNKVHYTDDRNRSRVWDAVERVNTRGAVILLSTFRPSGDLLLVRQFRPPAGRCMIEFPAGLIDPGETPEESAVRELYEETGYQGDIIAVHPATLSSPGLSGEELVLVEMSVDESRYPEIPEQHLEDTESIECLRIPAKDLSQYLKDAVAAGDGVDIKVLTYGILHGKKQI